MITQSTMKIVTTCLLNTSVIQANNYLEAEYRKGNVSCKKKLGDRKRSWNRIEDAGGTKGVVGLSQSQAMVDMFW